MTVEEYCKYVDDNIIISMAKEESDNLDFVYRIKYGIPMEDSTTEDLLINLDELGINMPDLSPEEVAAIYSLQSDYDNYTNILKYADTVTIYDEDDVEDYIRDMAECANDNALSQIPKHLQYYFDETAFIEDYISSTCIGDIQTIKDEVIIDKDLYYIIEN